MRFYKYQNNIKTTPVCVWCYDFGCPGIYNYNTCTISFRSGEGQNSMVTNNAHPLEIDAIFSTAFYFTINLKCLKNKILSVQIFNL